MQRRHHQGEEETKARAKNGVPLPPNGFSMPCKRQALISSLPSHPNFARFYSYALTFLFDSYSQLCLTSFTAVHFICGLAIR